MRLFGLIMRVPLRSRRVALRTAPAAEAQPRENGHNRRGPPCPRQLAPVLRLYADLLGRNKDDSGAPVRLERPDRSPSLNNGDVGLKLQRRRRLSIRGGVLSGCFGVVGTSTLTLQTTYNRVRFTSSDSFNVS